MVTSDRVAVRDRPAVGERCVRRVLSTPRRSQRLLDQLEDLGDRIAGLRARVDGEFEAFSGTGVA